MHQICEDLIFHHPFTCLVSGPTQSGKTTLLHKILIAFSQISDKTPTKIMYCYSRWQEKFNDLKRQQPLVEFNEGLPNIDLFDPKEVNVLILDDLMQQCGNTASICEIFTVDSHHKNISVFFLTQNLFPPEKYARTISRNCNYVIVFDNPRDRSQIINFAKQMFPSNTNFLTESFQDIINCRSYGYLFLDLTQHPVYGTSRNPFRVQTGICPDEIRIIYQEKK